LSCTQTQKPVDLLLFLISVTSIAGVSDGGPQAVYSSRAASRGGLVLRVQEHQQLAAQGGRAATPRGTVPVCTHITMDLAV